MASIWASAGNSIDRGLRVFVMGLAFVTASAARAEVHQSPEAFVAEAFGGGNPPTPSVLTLDAALKARAARIMGHDWGGTRVRYSGATRRTVWVLDEIGKEEPITTGVVIENDRIARIQVLEYRESRGGEVRHAFFTGQFRDATLGKDDVLDRDIDGISGATLSVRALTRLARLALLLHLQTPFAGHTP